LQTFERFLEEVAAESRLLGLSGYTLWQQRKPQLKRHASAILGYLEHRRVRNPVRRYARRNDELRQLQELFEETGRYEVSSYAEVQPEDLEIYNLSLLLSFLLTSHRFETLERLGEFLDLPTNAPQRLLSVGYGSGYEISIAQERLPDWRIEGYENSHEARTEAVRMLQFFERETTCLRFGEFPLEVDVDLSPWRDRYGKVIYCELLEHLEHPRQALINLGCVLHPNGHAFITMAVNIAQEDHIHHYRDIAQCREQIRGAGLRVLREWIAPVSVLPIPESEREARFRKGNFLAVVVRGS